MWLLLAGYTLSAGAFFAAVHSKSPTERDPEDASASEQGSERVPLPLSAELFAAYESVEYPAAADEQRKAA